jgi:hypothetical protein
MQNGFLNLFVAFLTFPGGKTMKLKAMFLGLCVAFLATSAMAVEDAATFQAAKDQQVANLQERVQIVQAHLTCVQAAADHAGLKACEATAKAAGDALEAKVKAARDAKKAAKAAH